LRNDFAPRALGIPIGPLSVWAPHFFYYYGGHDTYSIVPASTGWIAHEQTLLSFRYGTGSGTEVVEIKSPFAGIILQDRIKITTRDRVDFNYPGWGGIDDREFVVLKPLARNMMSGTRAGAPFEQVELFNAYAPLRSHLVKIIDSNRIFGFTDRMWRKLDPKRVFESKEQLIDRAWKLSEVKAVWLPDWDFSEPKYNF
jgi:hypothetical protein